MNRHSRHFPEQLQKPWQKILFASATKDRQNDRKYLTLNDALDDLKDVKPFWNEQ